MSWGRWGRWDRYLKLNSSHWSWPTASALTAASLFCATGSHGAWKCKHFMLKAGLKLNPRPPTASASDVRAERLACHPPASQAPCPPQICSSCFPPCPYHLFVCSPIYRAATCSGSELRPSLAPRSLPAVAAVSVAAQAEAGTGSYCPRATCRSRVRSSSPSRSGAWPSCTALPRARVEAWLLPSPPPTHRMGAR